MQIKERYVIAVEIIGLVLMVGALIYGIGIIPTVVIVASVGLILFAQIAKTR